MTCQLIHADCRDALHLMTEASVDAIVTDPPYELGFMGKGWDRSGIAYSINLWRECLRVLKPGGHLLAFGGTRTYHRMAVAIEDAGFEIRDSIHWLYGSGFPKSLNLKDEWHGWGTALKPAHEPIVVARRPLVGTVAANVLEHGTGALNIDGCRVGDPLPATTYTQPVMNGGKYGDADESRVVTTTPAGRWPANIVLTHAADCGDECVDGCPVGELDRQSGVTSSVVTRFQVSGRSGGILGNEGGARDYFGGFDDTGGASRFFTVTEWDVPFRYVAKPGKRERNAGLDGLPVVKTGAMAGNLVPGRRLAGNGTPIETPERQNFHPTVKPVALMRWLVRLVTPPNGTVLDPFAGSGTTLVAAILEGFNAIGIEMADDYLPIIHGRIAWAEQQPRDLFGGAA